MTEQPVETEQQFLGNVTREQLLESARYGAPLPATPLQHYTPNAHRLPYKPFNIADAELPAVEATFSSAEPDLWFQAEKQAEKGLVEIQNGNINAGIAFLQSALAFAQNYRHSLTEETAR